VRGFDAVSVRSFGSSVLAVRAVLNGFAFAFILSGLLVRLGLFVVLLWLASDKFVVLVFTRAGVVEEDTSGGFVAHDGESLDALDSFRQELGV